MEYGLREVVALATSGAVGALLIYGYQKGLLRYRCSPWRRQGTPPRRADAIGVLVLAVGSSSWSGAQRHYGQW